jgi:hypothetical protein
MSYLDCLNLQLRGGILVHNNHGVRVHLEAGQCPHVVHTAFDAPLQGQSFVCTSDNDDDLARLGFGKTLLRLGRLCTYIEDCLNSNSKCHFGHLVQIIPKEP